MARFNEILTGRFNRALQKFFSMKGGPPAPQLASEITPNIQFGSLGPDFRYLEGWNKFGACVSVGGSAANQSGIRMRNPATSNVVMVIEKLFLSFAQPNQVNGTQGTAATDLATLNSMSFLSFDLRANPGSAMIFSNQNTAVTVPALTNPALLLQRPTLGAGQEQVELVLTDDQELLLLPGVAHQYVVQAVNQQLFLTVWWRERFLEDSERT